MYLTHSYVMGVPSLKIHLIHLNVLYAFKKEQEKQYP